MFCHDSNNTVIIIVFLKWLCVPGAAVLSFVPNYRWAAFQLTLSKVNFLPCSLSSGFGSVIEAIRLILYHTDMSLEQSH